MKQEVSHVPSQSHYSGSGSLSTTVYGPDVEEGRDVVDRHTVRARSSYGDGRPTADGASDGRPFQSVSSGAQPCSLVITCSEQEPLAGARADLCECDRNRRLADAANLCFFDI